MRFYLDCEFNAQWGPLRSMGLSCEDKQHDFYEVVEWPEGTIIDPWVKENVEPILEKEPIPYHIFQSRLLRFLRQFPEHTMISDHPNDMYYLMQSMITGEKGKSMLDTLKTMTMVIKDNLSTKGHGIDGYSRGDMNKSVTLHNALSDAIAIRDHDLYLESIDLY